MKLYELTSDIARLEELLESNPEASEVVKSEALEFLQEMQVSRAEKIENCVALLKNWEALETAIKAEETALKARRESLEKRAQWLKNYLGYCLQPGEKFESAKCKISWRKSETVEIQEEAKIPPQFWREKVTREVDKKAIKETFQAGGEVEGVTIIKKNNLIIK